MEENVESSSPEQNDQPPSLPLSSSPGHPLPQPPSHNVQDSPPEVGRESPSQTLESSPTETVPESPSHTVHTLFGENKECLQRRTAQVRRPFVHLADGRALEEFQNTADQLNDNIVQQSPNQITAQHSDNESSPLNSCATPSTTPNRSPEGSPGASSRHAWPQYVECSTVSMPNISPAIGPPFLSECQEYRNSDTNLSQTSVFVSKTRGEDQPFPADCDRYGCVTNPVYVCRGPPDTGESYQYLSCPPVKSEYQDLPASTTAHTHPLAIKTEYQETLDTHPLSIKSEYQEPLPSTSFGSRSPTVKTEYQELTSEFSTPRERLTLPADPSKWSSFNVQEWLQVAVREFDLRGVDLARYQGLDGRQLCDFSTQDFVTLFGTHNAEYLSSNLAYLKQEPNFAKTSWPPQATPPPQGYPHHSLAGVTKPNFEHAHPQWKSTQDPYQLFGSWSRGLSSSGEFLLV
ncbi:hypothetical protein ScPMuIL_001972 [Solemya velum]